MKIALYVGASVTLTIVGVPVVAARFFLGYSLTVENYLRAVADQFREQAVLEPG
jgi:hypothetical protein